MRRRTPESPSLPGSFVRIQRPVGRRWRSSARGTSALRVALAVSIVVAITAGAAQARPAPSSSATRTAAAEASLPATCVVHSLPSFVAQGEFDLGAMAADIVEVECNPYVYGTGSRVKIVASQLFSRCKDRLTWYVPKAVTG